MNIVIKVEAFEQEESEFEDSFNYKSKVKCEIEKDIGNEELIKMTFDCDKVYYVNIEELSKAINIMNIK